MKHVQIVLDSWAAFWVALSLGCALAGFYFAPASYWLEVREVQAGPSTEYMSVPMSVDRVVHRKFFGTWKVVVKRFGVVGWVSYCDADGSSWYTPDSELPAKLDLDWWTSGTCKVLTKGDYIIDTVWRVDTGIPGMPTKIVESRSNIFKVL